MRKKSIVIVFVKKNVRKTHKGLLLSELNSMAWTINIESLYINGFHVIFAGLEN